MTTDGLPLYRYQDLNWRRLEHALERDGEVQLLLNQKRAAALVELIAAQKGIDRMRESKVPRAKKARAVLSVAWLVVRLSLKHRQLFEVQRLAFVLAPKHEVQKLANDEVLFRFSP